MRNKKATFKTLAEMIRCQEYEYFISDKLGNDMWVNDPDRKARLEKAAEFGADGSTHFEVIEDWREFLDSYKCEDPEFHEDSSEWEIDLTIYQEIIGEIDRVELWHKKNGSLDAELS